MFPSGKAVEQHVQVIYAHQSPNVFYPYIDVADATSSKGLVQWEKKA